VQSFGTYFVLQVWTFFLSRIKRHSEVANEKIANCNHGNNTVRSEE